MVCDFNVIDGRLIMRNFTKLSDPNRSRKLNLKIQKVENESCDAKRYSKY